MKIGKGIGKRRRGWRDREREAVAGVERIGL